MIISFWNSFLRALEVAPRKAEYVPGVSGFRHSIEALGLDKARRRLIIITREQGPRAAAFVEADLQSASGAVQVIVVRPSTLEIDGGSRQEGKGGMTPAAGAEVADVERRLEDCQAGLCYIRVEDFTTDEIGLISSGSDMETTREIFRRHHLLQYFFPAPDHLALGLIESGRVPHLQQIIDLLVRAPDLGHPFGPTELTGPVYSFTEMVKELQNLGLVREGPRGLELTDEGFKVRSTVRAAPREGLLYKILNRLEANLYLKSLLLPRKVQAGSSQEED